MEIKIRTAKVEDAEKLLDIYSYYVKKTAVTFEYEVPSVEEFQERIRLLIIHILSQRKREKLLAILMQTVCVRGQLLDGMWR